MTMRRVARLFTGLMLSCALAMVLPGCTSLGPQLPMASPDELALQDVSFGVRTLAPDGQFEVLPSGRLAQRLRDQLGERPLSVLALSGGGAGGAFGAGALVGLTRDGRRPEFTVVTGVSAGALIAPFVFLGPSRDQQVIRIFNEGASAHLLQPRWVGALFGSSLYSGDPLKRLIERYADDELISAVAAEAETGRLLLVGTTDLASGEPVIWDLGSIALYGGREAPELFRKILLASASVPGMFPPVVIRYRANGGTRVETHVDGAVSLPFFIAPQPSDLPAFDGREAQRTSARIIIDTRLRESPRVTKARAAAIFGRSVSAGLSRMTRAILESTVAATRARGISVSYAAIPASYPLQRAFDFSADGQRSLFQYALRCAEAGRLWTAVPQNGSAAAERDVMNDDLKCPADDSFLGRLAVLEH